MESNKAGGLAVSLGFDLVFMCQFYFILLRSMIMLVNLQDVVGQMDDAGIDAKEIVKLMRGSSEAIVPTGFDKLVTGARKRVNAIGKRIARVTED